MTRNITVTLTVNTEDEAEAIRVAESLSRTAIAFGLDGNTVSITIGTWEEDDDGDEREPS